MAREVAIGGKHLRNVADVAAYRARLTHDVETGHQRRSFAWRQQRGEHFDQRALARAVRAEQAKDGSAGAGEIQMIHGNKRTVAAGERPRLNGIGAAVQAGWLDLCPV